MTALLMVKQKIKSFYSDAEVFLLPVFKFLLALIYFIGINENLGFMASLNSPFIVVILALVCSVLPWNVIVYIGFALIIGHCYALGIETAVFVGILILFMLLMFMRFSKKNNIVLVFTEILLYFGAEALLPIGAGLLADTTSCMPAGCGVILFYFISYVSGQASVLRSAGAGDEEMLTRVKTLADGLINNKEMWLTVIAVVAVILLVRIIRSSSADYAWRIAIVAGGVVYLFIMLAGGLFLDVNVNMADLIIGTVISVIIGIILEFFVFGGDYSRTERLEYQDDEYYYYVKAVPKATVAVTSRSIKKINSEPVTDEESRAEESPKSSYANPIFKNEYQQEEDVTLDDGEEAEIPEEDAVSLNPDDFKRKLEESLKDL